MFPVSKHAPSNNSHIFNLTTLNLDALALSPGFFCFYAHIGVLEAIEEAALMNHTHVSGSSAGALVGGFLSAGMLPSAMKTAVLPIKKEHIWDTWGTFGLLKGQLFQELIVRNLGSVQTFVSCKFVYFIDLIW